MPDYISPVQDPFPPPISQPFIPGQHFGIDLAIPVGTPVLAIADGTVVFTGDEPNGAGLHTNVDHAGGVQARDFHLSAFEVVVGEQVTQGQVLGLSGNTGQSTGPHLHHEHRVNGTPVDPAPYLNQWDSEEEIMYVVYSVRDSGDNEVAIGSSVGPVLRHGNGPALKADGSQLPQDAYVVVSEADWAAAWATGGVAAPGGTQTVAVKVTAEVVD